LADGLDGALARRLGKTTEVGARLDVALDALGLLVAPVYGVRTGQLPPWYLLLSLAYYAFWGAVALRAELGLRCERAALCPSQHCRMYAGMQMAFVAVALWPGADARANTVVASIIVWPLLVAFWRDWLVVTGVVSVQSAGYQRVIRALVHHSRVTLPWLVRVLWLVWLVYLHLPSWQWPSLPGAALGVALLWGGLAARGAGLLVALTATLAPNALATMNLGPHAWVVGAGVCLVMFCRGKSACGPLWSYLGR
jgi:phosphatidylglycerophosphate synthase